MAEVTKGISSRHQVVDVVGLPRAQLSCARYAGACW
jgi:hypothetical protein